MVFVEKHCLLKLEKSSLAFAIEHVSLSGILYGVNVMIAQYEVKE